MSMDIEKLAQRVAALEKHLAAEDDKKEDMDEDMKEASEREVLASEIEALESKIASMDLLAEDEEEEDDEEEGEEVEAKKKASLVDPNGVEEQITQDYLTEVEGLEHGTELSTGDSMLDVAPTEFVARMKSASARLDAVAEYLEKTGRTELAFRTDKVADAIDARVAKIEVRR